MEKYTYHKYHPTTKDELEHVIEDRISKEGPNCDLNDIDVSLIEDMSYLFYSLEFNGNISSWDLSDVKNVCYMFAFSNFNQDISNWNIRKDCDTREMFKECPIKEEYKPELPL